MTDVDAEPLCLVASLLPDLIDFCADQCMYDRGTLRKMKGRVVDRVRAGGLDIGFRNREAGQANRPFNVFFMHCWSLSCPSIYA